MALHTLRSISRCGGFAAAALMCIIGSSGASSPFDIAATPSAGTIVIPVERGKAEAVEPVDNPEDYSFYLMPFDNQSDTSFFPCGGRVVLPAGRFMLWVEGPNSISSQLETSAPPLADRPPFLHEFAIEVGPAGRIRIEHDQAFPNQEELEVRLMSVDSHVNGKNLGREFARRESIFSAVSKDGIPMPAGEALAVVFDRARGRYLRLSKPVMIKEGETGVAAVEYPVQGRAALIARLDRPGPVNEVRDIQPYVIGKDEVKHEPDVVVRSMARIYAIWLGLDPGTAKLAVNSPEFWFETVPVGLFESQITDFSGLLSPRVTLDLEIVLPDQNNGNTTVTVHDTLTEEELSTVTVEQRFPVELVFEKLPPHEVMVTVDNGPWLFEAESDLTHGDQRLLMAPESAEITGQIVVNDEGSPGAVMFLTNKSGRGKEVTSDHQTDRNGLYEAVIFPAQLQPVASVTVGTSTPMMKWLDMPVNDGDVIDFVFEGKSVGLRIVDSITGSGIPEATITYRWFGENSGGRSEKTDQDGRLLLPPLPEQKVEVAVKASGYQTSFPRAFNLECEDDEILIMLEPENADHELSVVLDDGAPAGGAVVSIVSEDGLVIRWSGNADQHGHLELPDFQPQDFVAARHDRGGLRLVSCADLLNAEPMILGLPLSAGMTTFVVSLQSGDPAYSAQLVLWIDGVRLAGPILSLLLDAPPGTLPDGSWSTRFLPAEEFAVFAWIRTSDSFTENQVVLGRYDYRKEIIQHPWSSPIELEAVFP